MLIQSYLFYIYNDIVKLFYYLILCFDFMFYSFIITVTWLPSLNKGFILPCSPRDNNPFMISCVASSPT